MKKETEKTEYDATYTKIKSIPKMLCSLPTYVIKINVHGTTNPNYKVRERQWNEIGK